MPISNPISTPASEGILRYVGIPETAETPGYFNFHDGKWIILSSNAYRSIGNAQSGADIAQDWLFKLYSFIASFYNTPIYTSTGQPSAKTDPASDWSNNKRLALPDFRGRVLMSAGTGQGLSERVRGALLGEERHVLTIAEMPAHTHAATFAAGDAIIGTVTLTPSSSRSNTQPGPNTTSVGGNSAHNNIQPSIVQSLFISAGVF